MEKNIAAVAGLGLGFALGFIVGGVYTKQRISKRLEEEYAELAYQDIEEVKDHYKRRYKEGEYADPTTLAAAKGLISEQDYGKVETTDGDAQMHSMEDARVIDIAFTPDGLGAVEVIEGVTDEPASERHNVFDEHNEERESLRAQGKPYIITDDEFGEEHGWDTIALSYFEEDDVLMDTDEKPIDHVERLVGKANLNRFGEISGDPNILYIRNEALRTDFEIAKEEGSYAKTVLNIDPEPPQRRKRTRPRPSDDDE